MWQAMGLPGCEAHHGGHKFKYAGTGALGVVAGRPYQLCYADLNTKQNATDVAV
jgi:hypothetical protein